MTAKRYPPVNTEKAAQKKDKLRRRKTVAEDRPQPKPFLDGVKSNYRRLDRSLKP